MNRHLPARLLLLLATIVAVSTACERDTVSRTGNGSQESTTVLRRGNGGDPETLDPSRAEDNHSFNVLADLYEGLLAIDSRGKLIPGVAKNWEVGSDGLIYTFHLDENAHWSNGAPVLAEHFLAGFIRTLTPATGSPYNFLLHPIRNAAEVLQGDLPPSALGIAAPDARTLTIELHEPAAHFLSILAMPIAFPLWPGGSPEDDQFSDPQNFVGNGPFVLEEWHPGNRIRLRKNTRYRDAKSVHIDFVEFYAIQDPLSEFNMYRAGEIDITATVPGANIDAIRNTRENELYIAPSLGIYYLAFDLSEEPLDDRALRQALTMAIDRNALVEIIGRGEQPAYGFVPDGVSGYTPTRYDWYTLDDDQREAEARRIFASSKFASSRPLPLKLTYDVGDIHEKVALAVSSMWRDVLGIDVELDKREWKYFLATRDVRDEWQVMRFAWTGDYNHPSTFTDILNSASPQNLPGYKNSRYDELNDAALAEQDPRTQSHLFSSAEATMLDDYPIAPLYFYVSKHLVGPTIEGYENNALDQHPSRFLRFKDDTSL